MKEWINKLKTKWVAWFDPSNIEPKLRAEFHRIDQLSVDEARTEFWDRLLTFDLEYEDANDTFKSHEDYSALPASAKEILERFHWIQSGFMSPRVDRSQVKRLDHDGRFTRIGETSDGDIVCVLNGREGAYTFAENESQKFGHSSPSFKSLYHLFLTSTA